MSKIKIVIAEEFSKYPAGRFKADGEFSAERFRDDILIPKIKENETVVINFDGTAPYGSSFLEEAFGGLVRKGIDISKIELETNNELLKKEIQTYIDEAQNNG